MGCIGPLSQLLHYRLAFIIVTVIKSFFRWCLVCIWIVFPLKLVNIETVIGVKDIFDITYFLYYISLLSLLLLLLDDSWVNFIITTSEDED